MQQHAALPLIIKKLSSIYYSVFKVFLLLNIILLGATVYLSKGSGGTFLFFVFFMNYWIMMIFFCLLSMYIKLFLCMTHLDNLEEDQSWIYSVIFFPLLTEENEDDFLQFVMQQSMDNTQERETLPPTTENLESLETKWKTVMMERVVPEETKNETCLICSNPYHHDYPSHRGCIVLGCCTALFHKKCVLEWFHFNEKQDQSQPEKSIVSCPSCRHVFSL